MRANWWLVCLAAASTAPLSADDDFPYQAYVAADGVEVVSGPGHRYYATDRLSRGVKVEVYREEASGWLAIRPPAGSFSWIAADFVERDEEDQRLGRVTEPTPAWIGTTAERVSEHRQHVTLKSDEVVRILGEKQVETDEGEETWLKIAPPAGEFRWIHLRDVSRQRPEPLVIQPAVPEPEPVLEQESPREPRRIETPRDAIALRDLAPPAREVEQAQFRSASEPVGKSISSDGFVPRKRRGSEPLQTVPTPSEQLASRKSATFTRPKLDPPPLAAVPARSTFSTVSASSSKSSSLETVTNQLERLELDLSAMVAQERSSWDLTGLRQQVEELVQRGSDPVARGNARLLLDKIKQFEQVFDAEESAAPAATAAGPQDSAADSPADPRYDGRGWLKPVVSRRSEKPPAPFALVDADGKPLVFITPSPGLNLNRYVNKQIGVYGRRGYIESLKTSHVTAERVIDLTRHLR
jgi:uncharacterized protein YgiM (DUF1202 family)